MSIVYIVDFHEIDRSSRYRADFDQSGRNEKAGFESNFDDDWWCLSKNALKAMMHSLLLQAQTCLQSIKIHLLQHIVCK